MYGLGDAVGYAVSFGHHVGRVELNIVWHLNNDREGAASRSVQSVGGRIWCVSGERVAVLIGKQEIPESS